MSPEMLRPTRVAEDDLVAYARAVNRHFHESEEDEDVLPWVEALGGSGYRAWWVRTADLVAGNLGVIETEISVPGGAHLPFAGVTAVGVAQTMRRRGVMRDLMLACLEEAVEHGEPLAGLYASEAPIYGRFGFGVAAPGVSYRIDRSRLGFRDPVDVRLVQATTPEAAREAWPQLHAAVRARRGASVAKQAGMWDLGILRDIPGWRGGASARRLVEVPGRGYASYRVKESYDGLLPAGSVRLLELIATDAEAEAALWQHVTDVDLTTTVDAPFRPVDDALPYLVTDQHALRLAESPPLYLRILDVPRVLTARTYPARGQAVLEVLDPLGYAQGRWRLEVDEQGASCEPTSAEADLVLPVACLPGIVHGGVRATTFLAARWLEERTPGAAAALDRLVAVDRAPWTTMEF
ncbi:MAG: GNAT family N-acetyltransferase [Nitriliruptoraceae bacterium]